MIVHLSHPRRKRGISQPAAISRSRRIGRTWVRKDGPQVERPSAGRAWNVNFDNGNCNHNDIDNDNYVRAVRS